MQIQTEAHPMEVESVLLNCLKKNPAGLTDGDLENMIKPKGLSQQ